MQKQSASKKFSRSMTFRWKTELVFEIQTLKASDTKHVTAIGLPSRGSSCHDGIREHRTIIGFWTIMSKQRFMIDYGKPDADVEAPEFLRCALDPRNKLCQMKASLSTSSISFSVQDLVGRACKNIMTSYNGVNRKELQL